MDFRIISIGTLSQNELWPGDKGGRTPHATVTLIRSGDQVILVDPALPAQLLAARLMERSGLELAAVTDVFLTNFRPAHRWGLPGLTHAKWHIAEAEREAIGRSLVERFQAEQDEEVRALLQQDITLLQRCGNAADKLAKRVDLFPLPGFTPGTCGLLLLDATTTTLVAGDAVATCEHLSAGQVLRHAADLELARASFAEAVEIADVIICGHDNVMVNPTRRGM